MSNDNSLEELCMTEECAGKSKYRGVCYGCYFRAKKLVKEGKTTIQELVELGLLEPSKKKIHRFEKAFFSRKQS